MPGQDWAHGRQDEQVVEGGGLGGKRGLEEKIPHTRVQSETRSESGQFP